MTKLQALMGMLLLAALSACAGPKKAASATQSSVHDLPVTLPAFDRAQFEAMMTRKFQQLDRDRNGQLHLKSELSRLRGHWIAGSDHNRNGKVSIIEFMRAADAAFTRVDSDHDGTLTQAEYSKLGLE